MSAGEYLVGLVFFALMLAGTLGGAWLLLSRRWPQLTGATRISAFGVLASVGVLAVHLVPAMLTVLSRGTVVVASAVWLLAAWRVRPVAAEASPPPDPTPRESGPLVWALAAACVALVGLFFLAMLRNLATISPPSVDYQNFHMPGVLAWIATGSVWQIDVFLPDVAPGNYPNNGDVMLLAAVLPWRNDFLGQLAMYPFLALTGVAVYALARELRAPHPAAAIVGCLVVAIPSVTRATLVLGLVDALMLFAFSVGLLSLVRHWRTGRSSELVLAGLALGVSFGTKWYAVSSVAAVVGVWALAALVAGRGLGRVVRHGGALVGLIGLTGGVWFVRNLLESANPFFPVKLAPLGVTLFDAPHDRVRELAGFTILDYINAPDAWREYILPAYREALAGPAALIGLGLLAALAVLAVRVWRRRSRRGRRLPRQAVALIGVACALLLAAIYSVTPYTAGGPEGMPVLTGADARYLLPAVLVAAAITAWVAGRFRHGLLALGILGLLAVVDGLRLVSGGQPGSANLLRRDVLTALLAVALLAAAAAALIPAFATLQGRTLRRALLAFGCVVALGVAGVGYELQQRYSETRYQGADPVVDALFGEAGSSQRIGLAGLWTDEGIAPPLPAFGPDFDNEVEYVGPVVEEMLRRYRSEADFVAALRRGRYDYLLIGAGRPPLPETDEERWAEAAGYESVARSERLSLMRSG